MDITATIAKELALPVRQVQAAVALLDDGNTVPFISRYRKEATGGLDDTCLRKLVDRLTYLRNLEKRKEEVEIRNTADNMVYQTEKTLGELGDKIDESEKSGIQAEVDKLKELLKADPFDADATKAQTEAVTQKFYAVSEKLYQNAAPQGGQGCDPNCGGCGNDGVVDADYETVD